MARYPLYDRTHWRLMAWSERWSDICWDRAWKDWTYEVWPTDRLARLTCWAFRRHKPVNDHCGLPEHRACVFCNRAMPHAELAA